MTSRSANSSGGSEPQYYVYKHKEDYYDYDNVDDYSSRKRARVPSIRLDDRRTLYFLKLIIDGGEESRSRNHRGPPRLYVLSPQSYKSSPSSSSSMAKRKRKTSSLYSKYRSGKDANSYLPIVVLNSSGDNSDGGRKTLKKQRRSYVNYGDFYDSGEQGGDFEITSQSKRVSDRYSDDLYDSRRRNNRMSSHLERPRHWPMSYADDPHYYYNGYGRYHYGMPNPTAFQRRVGGGGGGMYGSYSDGSSYASAIVPYGAASFIRAQAPTSSVGALTSWIDMELVVLLAAIGFAVYFLNGVVTMAANGSGRRGRKIGGTIDAFDAWADLVMTGQK